MKKAQIIKRVVVLPVVLGVVIGIIFCIGFNQYSSKIFSLADGVEIAYHDNLDELEGATAGTLITNNDSISIKYDNSYSNLAHNLIITDSGNGFDEIGCVYLQCLASTFDTIKGCDEIEINFNGLNLKYKFVERIDDENEYDITHYCPDASKSVVIYSQETENGGILNSFDALVFEEVE